MKLNVFKKVDPIVKNITLGISTSWFGWGLVESLIPIFIFSIVGTYTETAIFSSIYTIVFLISVPFLGVYADHISLRKMLLWCLTLYILTGTSYFFSSFLGIIFFIVLAKIFVGLATAFGQTARETAFLRYQKLTGKAFAFFETFSNIIWFLGVVISLIIAPILDINWFFILIIIFSLLGLPFLLRLPKMKFETNVPIPRAKNIIVNTFRFSAFKYFHKKDRLLMILIGVLPSFVLVLPTTFLSISSYVSSNDIRFAILITAVSALPPIFSMFLARSSDIFPRRSVLFGFIIVIISLLLFSFANGLVLQMIVSFLTGVGIQMIYLSLMVLIKNLTIDGAHLGAVESTFSVLDSIGGLLGMLIIGYLLDKTNSLTTGLLVSLFLFVMTIILSFTLFRKR